MSIRLTRRAPKGAVAMAGLLVAALALSGCSSLGSRTFGDSTTTSSLPSSSPSSFSQPMPASVGSPQAMVAENQYMPPANVGGAGGWNSPPAQQAWNQSGSQPLIQPAQNSWNQPIQTPGVQSQALPVLSNQASQGTPAMQAQPAFASATPMPSPAVLGSLPTNNSVPTMAATTPAPAAAAAGGQFKHTIAGGESLYTIARRYEVTTQSLVQANGLSSPDKIVVGQSIIIPGRADLLATKAPTQVASLAPQTAPAPAQQALPQGANALQAATPVAPAQPAVTPAPAQAAPAAAPAQTASVAPAEVKSTGGDKFRWPASGRVITDFASSKGTGINIEVPEGSAVKAAEAGTVIYVGSGVEGYGNLVLIRHQNGFVSAYAHLSSMSVAKGATVNRGDSIGAAGMTGSVTKPQLHFELRKGATPVDPVPLLAS